MATLQRWAMTANVSPGRMMTVLGQPAAAGLPGAICRADALDCGEVASAVMLPGHPCTTNAKSTASAQTMGRRPGRLPAHI